MARHTEFELWQDGECVAIVGCEKPADAVREIMHYAAMYGQDGPVEITRRYYTCRTQKA